MARHTALSFLCAAVLFTGIAAADDAADDKKVTVGADAHLLVPVGEFAENTAPAIGPLLRLGYRFLPELEVGVRSGYLLGLDKKYINLTTSFSIVPIWLGARYFVMEPGAGLYGAAEVGVNYGKRKVRGDILGQAVEREGDFEGRFGFNVGAGYLISRAVPIDLRAQFSYLNLLGTRDGEHAALAIGFSAGYTATF